MVVDTICNSRDRPEECAFWTDKLSFVFGNTYATAAGDADMINGLRLVVDFLDPKRPNLRDPATFDAILGAVERIWALREKAGAQRYGSNGSVLFICTRADVFYWVAGYDGEARRFERPLKPHVLAESECVIFWGSDRFTIRELEKYEGALNSNPVGTLAALIEGVDGTARAEGKKGLLYRLDGRFSGVVLPHKSSTSLTRIRPFSPPELLVREQGPTLLSTLEDKDFMRYQLPTGA